MGNNYSELNILKDPKLLSEKGFIIYSSDKNKKKGRIIFSLDDFPLKETLYSASGNRLYRHNNHVLEINDWHKILIQNTVKFTPALPQLLKKQYVKMPWDLSKKLTLKIFSYFKVRNFVSISRVCKAFYYICGDSKRWKKLYIYTFNTIPLLNSEVQHNHNRLSIRKSSLTHSKSNSIEISSDKVTEFMNDLKLNNKKNNEENLTNSEFSENFDNHYKSIFIAKYVQVRNWGELIDYDPLKQETLEYQAQSVYKFVLAGPSNSGKTCITNTLGNSWIHGTTPSIGSTRVNFSCTSDDGKQIIVKVDDVAGEDRYLGLVGTYFRESDLIILVFDITDLSSFDSLKTTWLPLVRQEASGTPIVLVANKIDLSEERRVPYQTVVEYALKEKLPYFEISAKDIVTTKLFLRKVIEYINKIRQTQKKN
eukprot:TRINITY_DN7442_c0_g1_i1.p1 TRINITY_DN7442_c0_g1~~TRINITY_DN7442_c0_g1_i1.p1  ORF type:complete len:423 (+),score=113.67 TRINITY_DN7442_c0_g1_i1:72-1340(+)